LLFCVVAAAQAPNATYLLRLDHSNFEGHSCALLQTSGKFHLEINHGDDIKVFEGTIPDNDLLEIERELNNGPLAGLSQQQIQEPLIRTRHDELQVTVFRGDGWQNLYFRSSDSQQPFELWLKPLVHWLDNLHKLPHREFSEDEGKNNCLPARPITLKKRDEATPQPSVTSKTTAHILSAGPTPRMQQVPPLPDKAQAIQMHQVPALLRMHSFEMNTEGARDNCALIGENGMYRFEDRTQKTGKGMNTRITSGQITSGELQQLNQILDDPALEAIKHHEPPGHGDVYVMGDMVDVSIFRPAGVQHFVLSSRFKGPNFSSFYNGDADVSSARALLNFLREHLESSTAAVLDPAKRNGCTEAP
jgi:hypothetical protein